MRRALVILSGGQDSTTALFVAKRDCDEVHALTFHYGQRHQREIESAKKVAEMAQVASHEVLDLRGGGSEIRRGADWTSIGAVLLGNSPLTNDTAVPHYTGVDQLAKAGEPEPTFVPGRNILFLALAANRAAVLRAQSIYLGVCEADYGGYPDCRLSFIDAMAAAIGLGISGDRFAFQVFTPLMTLTKAESVRVADTLPGCMDALAYSHTCLTEGTMVWALRGQTPIEQLTVGQYVWGWDEGNSCWWPTQVEAVYDQGVKSVFRVTLKDRIGRLTSFDATADHRLMRRTGGYVRVDELEVGTRLKAASVSPQSGGYYTIKPHNDWREPNTYMHRYVAQCLGFADEVIHHKDNDGTNNDPSNLTDMTLSDHSKLHYPAEAINGPEALTRREETCRRFGLRSFAARQSAKNLSPETARNRMTKAWRTRRRQAVQENHVVISIKPVGETRTWDITTGTRNFALGAGIFVHNCYDGMYPPNPFNHASLLRAKGFAEAGKADPLIVRAKAEGLLPIDYPTSGLVEGTEYNDPAVYAAKRVPSYNETSEPSQPPTEDEAPDSTASRSSGKRSKRVPPPTATEE